MPRPVRSSVSARSRLSSTRVRIVPSHSQSPVAAATKETRLARGHTEGERAEQRCDCPPPPAAGTGARAASGRAEVAKASPTCSCYRQSFALVWTRREPPGSLPVGTRKGKIGVRWQGRTDPKLELIAAVPLFGGFNRREIEGARGGSWTRSTVKAGRVLMREGAVGREFFIVVSGNVRVERNGRKVNELGPGDFLGEIALIDHGPRTATATAADACRLLVLDIGGFRTLVSKYPTVQGKIMKALAERLREAQPRAVD